MRRGKRSQKSVGEKEEKEVREVSVRRGKRSQRSVDEKRKKKSEKCRRER